MVMSQEVSQKYLRRLMLGGVYLTAILAPLFYFPWTIEPLFAKQAAVILLAIFALVCWLVRILVLREVRWRSGLLNVVFAALFLVFLAGAVFSVQPGQSFFAPDTTGERFFSVVAFLILAFLVANDFSRRDAELLVFVIFLGAAFSGLLTLVQILPIPLPGVLFFNPVGTIGASALSATSFFLLALAFILFGDREKNYSRLFRVFIWAVFLVSAANIFLLNFASGWIGLAVTVSLLIAFAAARFSLSVRSSIVLLLILISSVLFSIFSPHPERLISGLRTRIEVAPSFQSTVKIGLETLREKPILGTGLGTFVYGYNRFRPEAVNQTVFWDAKFNHGFSLATTLLTTLGALGVLMFLVFVATAISILWRVVNYLPSIYDPLALGFASVAIFGIVLWFIYPSNFSMNVLIFLAVGGLAAVAPEVSLPTFSVFGHEFAERVVRIESQGRAFLTSLVATAGFIFVIIAGYMVVQKYIAEVAFAAGVRVFNEQGNIDEALTRFARARFLDSRDDRYASQQAQLFFLRTQESGNRILAGGGQDAQTAFRANLNSAVEAVRAAISLNERNPEHWILLGAIYEAALPFVDGADGLAVSAYNEAAMRDPKSPAPPAFSGRTFLAIADLAGLKVRQGVLKESEGASLAAEAIMKAKESLERATTLKSDYAIAQFLLAQALTREGNIDEAIRRGVAAAIAAPQDVGVAFFLGFLLYQKELLVDAEEQFSRAVALNPNYSNARYFLGLIYDRTGREGEALKQFRKIEELNPDNAEVKQIVENLEAGRGALETIPPPPPEKRRNLPVR